MKSKAFKIAKPEPLQLTTGSLFNEARMKVYRARHHAHEVSFVWEASVHSHYAAVMRGEANRPDGSVNLLNPPLMANIPLGIGDCIRNLRSALDYLISTLARNAQLPDDQTIFPFNKERSGIEQSFAEPKIGDNHRKGRKAGALYEVSRKYPELKNILLNRIKPYSADDGADAFGDFLWRVITSDNVDKHRLMTPTIQRVTDLNLRTNNGIRFISQGQGGVIGNAFAFEAGTKFENDSDFSLDILFEEPARLAGKPVTSTLVEAIESVDQVITIFDAAFKRPS